MRPMPALTLSRTHGAPDLKKSFELYAAYSAHSCWWSLPQTSHWISKFSEYCIAFSHPVGRNVAAGSVLPHHETAMDFSYSGGLSKRLGFSLGPAYTCRVLLQ